MLLHLQTTRAPNPFEISPRPFVTPSPLPSRGQFSNFGQTSGRQNGGYQFESNPYNFAPSAQPQQPQRLNPYLDTTGYDEVRKCFFISTYHHHHLHIKCTCKTDIVFFVYSKPTSECTNNFLGLT